MDFSFKKDKGEKLTGPRRNYMGQPPPQGAQKGKHQLLPRAFAYPDWDILRTTFKGQKGHSWLYL